MDGFGYFQSWISDDGRRRERIASFRSRGVSRVPWTRPSGRPLSVSAVTLPAYTTRLVHRPDRAVGVCGPYELHRLFVDVADEQAAPQGRVPDGHHGLPSSRPRVGDQTQA